jgi:hypothetical protein
VACGFRPAPPVLVRRRLPPNKRLCLACLRPIRGRRRVCGDQCDALAWRIVPTLDGELWEPGKLARRCVVRRGGLASEVIGVCATLARFELMGVCQRLALPDQGVR